MTAPRHTAGPWVRDGHNLSTILHCTSERGSPEARHITGDYEVIAECEGENWAANSLAIAALPDLLTALINMVAAAEHCGDGEAPVVLAAISAINKATVQP